MRAPLLTRTSALSAALALAAAAGGQTVPRVIVSTVSSDPTSLVPGGDGTQRFRGLGRPAASPDGSRWVLVGSSTATSSQDLLLLGANSGGYAVELEQGDVAPWDNTTTVGKFDRIVAINDAGQIVFSESVPSTSTRLDRIVRGVSGGAYQQLFLEGDAATAAGDNIAFDGFDSVGIVSDGTVYFGADLAGDVASDTDTAVFFGSALVARQGVSTPSGQSTIPPAPYKLLRDPYRSADGTRWLLPGDLDVEDEFGNPITTQDSALIVDGQVVVQEGSVLPGSDFTEVVSRNSAGLGSANMAPNGDWFLRGGNGTGTSPALYWVARNGQVIAEEGQPIFPGSTELWSRRTSTPAVFYLSFGNAAGDYVVGGASDIGLIPENDETLSGVLVLNNERVVLRSSDPVDLNGNGLADDNTYIRAFFLDSAFITPDHKLYVIVQLKNVTGVGPTIGNALLVKDVSICRADFDNQNGVQVADIFAFLRAWFANAPSADFDGQNGIQVADIFAFLRAWFAGC